MAVGRRDRLLLASLAGAYAAFALTFRGPRGRFWHRMTSTGLVLGTLALATERDLRRTRVHLSDVVLGLASAGALYAIFGVGDRMARRLVPGGGEQIEEMYALRELRPTGELAGRLALVIAPAEELFWRGLVQRRLARRLGPWPAAAAATAAYAGAHVVTGNVTLTGAAGVAGAFWSALAAAGMPMGALIACHAAWDIWIFLIAPTTGGHGTVD
jgi:membrane protease YdiL (CAAX protease family)